MSEAVLNIAASFVLFDLRAPTPMAVREIDDTSPVYTAAYSDTCSAVDREMELIAKLSKAEAALELLLGYMKEEWNEELDHPAIEKGCTLAKQALAEIRGES